MATLAQTPAPQTLGVQTQPAVTYVVRIIPGRQTAREVASLEAAIAALAATDSGPIALEIVGTSRGRYFLARAVDPDGLEYLARQLQARYPQAEISPLAPEDDPLRLAPGEQISGLELRPGAQPYLPLRTPRERELSQEGADPVLGLLAAFGSLPSGIRVVTQLALLPAPDTWADPHRRLAVEHPLEPERARERRDLALTRADWADGGATSFVGVVLLLALALGLLALQKYGDRLPAWLQRDAVLALHGQAPTLTSSQVIWLAVLSTLLLAIMFTLAMAVGWVRGHLIGRRGSPLYDQRLVQEKTARVAYRARLRIVVIASRAGAVEPAVARTRQRMLRAFLPAYRQFHLASGAHFTLHPLSDSVTRRVCAHNRRGMPSGWRRGLRRSPLFLSVADVAALWHLPQAQDLADLPLVESTRARTLLVPDSLSQPDIGFPIGVSIHAGHRLTVALPPDALQRNLLAIAKTGKGKSTLLLSLAQAALADTSCGLVLIDPHGDLAEAVLGRIPVERRDDVLLVDLGDPRYAVAVNPLDVTLFRDRDKTVSDLIAVLSRNWPGFWGPRMESALEAALKTLYESNRKEVAEDAQDGPDRQFTLLDVPAVLSRDPFRHQLLGRIQDPALADYWLWFESQQVSRQQEIATPVTTKIEKFSNSVLARRIVGQPRSTLDLGVALGPGSVLIVKTARGLVGEDTAQLIGAMLLGFLQVTIAAQAGTSLEQRRRVRVLIDEFQTLWGVDYAAMLGELRKFGATFALATQTLAYLDELDKSLRPTIMANIDQLFAFATSAEDARTLEGELDKLITVADLVNLGDFQCYARLTVNGRRAPIFSLQLERPPQTTAEQRAAADAIRVRSRTRIARPVARADLMVTQAVLRRRVAPAARGRTAASPPVDSDMTATSADGASGGRPKRSGARSHWARRGGTSRLAPTWTQLEASGSAGEATDPGKSPDEQVTDEAAGLARRAGDPSEDAEEEPE